MVSTTIRRQRIYGLSLMLSSSASRQDSIDTIDLTTQIVDIAIPGLCRRTV